jgi:hypothetical protein
MTTQDSSSRLPWILKGLLDAVRIVLMFVGFMTIVGQDVPSLALSIFATGAVLWSLFWANREVRKQGNAENVQSARPLG